MLVKRSHLTPSI